MDTLSRLRQNLKNVESAIQQACDRTHRNRQLVQLLPITKNVSAQVVLELHKLGFSEFGESRQQDAKEKIDILSTLSPSPKWHFIGHLQSNKVNKVVGAFHLIHSINSPELLAQVNRRAAQMNIRQNILLQPYFGKTPSKTGVSDPMILEQMIASLSNFHNICCLGFMTLADPGPDTGAVRAAFQGLRLTAERWASTLGLTAPVLSMGMSQDFEIAIEEGATLLRIGSLLFDGLGGG